jgi:hypothetical protein
VLASAGALAARNFAPLGAEVSIVKTFLLFCLLLVVCAPLAIAVLVLYPLIWVLLLPFRLLGVAVDGVFGLLRAVLTLPARILGVRPRRRLYGI